jgi:hypothetical protein
MNGLRQFIQTANSWTSQDYVRWLSGGLFELAAPSEEGLPFHPLFLVSTLEPLGQLHQAIKGTPGAMRSEIHSALRDVLSALSPDRPARYCDLAWRLAAALRPPGGLTEQALHLLSFPSVETQDSAWRECIRSVLRGVLAYAKTREIDEFIEDFRASRHWRPEFAWTYGQYLVRREPKQWVDFFKDFEKDISADRIATPRGYRRRLRTLITSMGPQVVAQQFAAFKTSEPLFTDLTDRTDPIVVIRFRGAVLEIEVGGAIAEYAPEILDVEAGNVVSLEAFRQLRENTLPENVAQAQLLERARRMKVLAAGRAR